MYKIDLALNELQWSICHKTKPINLYFLNIAKYINHIYIYIYTSTRIFFYRYFPPVFNTALRRRLLKIKRKEKEKEKKVRLT